MEISHKEFIASFKEKYKYEKMKGNLRNASEKKENMRLNSVNPKTYKNGRVVDNLRN